MNKHVGPLVILTGGPTCIKGEKVEFSYLIYINP